MDFSSSAQAVLSWNINGGHRDKFSVIKGLLLNCDVLCLQEHFLTSHFLGLLKIGNNFLAIRCPLNDLLPVAAPRVVLRCLLGPHAGRVFLIHVIFFFAVCVEEYVLVNVYLPIDYHIDRSEFVFISTCEKLGSGLSKLHQLDEC